MAEAEPSEYPPCPACLKPLDPRAEPCMALTCPGCEKAAYHKVRMGLCAEPAALQRACCVAACLIGHEGIVKWVWQGSGGGARGRTRGEPGTHS